MSVVILDDEEQRQRRRQRSEREGIRQQQRLFDAQAKEETGTMQVFVNHKHNLRILHETNRWLGVSIVDRARNERLHWAVVPKWVKGQHQGAIYTFQGGDRLSRLAVEPHWLLPPAAELRNAPLDAWVARACAQRDGLTLEQALEEAVAPSSAPNRRRPRM